MQNDNRYSLQHARQADDAASAVEQARKAAMLMASGQESGQYRHVSPRSPMDPAQARVKFLAPLTETSVFEHAQDELDDHMDYAWPQAIQMEAAERRERLDMDIACIRLRAVSATDEDGFETAMEDFWLRLNAAAPWLTPEEVEERREEFMQGVAYERARSDIERGNGEGFDPANYPGLSMQAEEELREYAANAFENFLRQKVLDEVTADMDPSRPGERERVNAGVVQACRELGLTPEQQTVLVSDIDFAYGTAKTLLNRKKRLASRKQAYEFAKRLAGDNPLRWPSPGEIDSAGLEGKVRDVLRFAAQEGAKSEGRKRHRKDRRAPAYGRALLRLSGRTGRGELDSALEEVRKAGLGPLAQFDVLHRHLCLCNEDDDAHPPRSREERLAIESWLASLEQ